MALQQNKFKTLICGVFTPDVVPEDNSKLNVYLVSFYSNIFV